MRSLPSPRGLVAAALFTLVGGALPAPGQDSQEVERPPDLVVLVDKPSTLGTYTLGVFLRRPDPQTPGMWSVKIWEEVDERVSVATDRVSCDPAAPMRITRQRGQLEMRLLNPGGVITPANRTDHLIWWAVCAPALAARDPASLAVEARRLGYSGVLVERRDLLPAGR
ncbi:MAG: hypothetical protein VKK62_09845 [Synechococcaceae cyanobacterium]|nr:hypothetical protein [Synechococcaceae cyanobacterium]